MTLRHGVPKMHRTTQKVDEYLLITTSEILQQYLIDVTRQETVDGHLDHSKQLSGYQRVVDNDVWHGRAIRLHCDQSAMSLVVEIESGNVSCSVDISSSLATVETGGQGLRPSSNEIGGRRVQNLGRDTLAKEDPWRWSSQASQTTMGGNDVDSCECRYHTAWLLAARSKAV